MKRSIVAFVALTLFVMVTDSPFAEGLFLFPEQDVEELILIETDYEAGSFSFIDESGEIQDGIIGDLIGTQQLTVVEVLDVAVVAASYEEYDWYGTIRIRTNTIKIPKARIFEGGKGVR